MNKLKILAFILLIIVAEKTYSQDSTLTLFKLPHISSVGIYAAPEFQYGQLDKTFTNFGGGAIMIILNNHFAFGGSWIQNMTIRYSPNDLNKLFLKSSFGGLKFEYTINPNSIVHFSFPVLIGMGMSRLDSSFHNNKFKSDSIHKNFLIP